MAFYSSSIRVIGFWCFVAVGIFALSGFVVEWQELVGLKKTGLYAASDINGAALTVEQLQQQLQKVTAEKERLELTLQKKLAKNVSSTANITSKNGNNTQASEPAEQVKEAEPTVLETVKEVPVKEEPAPENVKPEPAPESDADTTEIAAAPEPAPAVTTEGKFTAQELLAKRKKGLPMIDEFDKDFTVDDYNKLEPMRPSHKWLQSCADYIPTRPDIVKPYPQINPLYALGDCLKRCYKCRYFSETFADLYFTKACHSPKHGSFNNKTVIAEVFREFEEHPRFELPAKPANDTVVFHLRLGDVMESKKSPPGPCLSVGCVTTSKQGYRKATKEYVKTGRSFDEYYETLLPYNFTHVAIVGGGLTPEPYKISRVYAHCLSLAMARTGFEVEMRFDEGNADKDFYYMSNAKYFIPGGGGYSRIIKYMVRHFGGTVIGRDLDSGPLTYTTLAGKVLR